MIKKGRRRPLFQAGETTQTVDLGRAALERMLPHRDPFLLLDGIDQVDLQEEAIRGRRRVAEDDPVFAGHFPGDPVYPGVLQVEAIGQLGICLQHLLSRGSCTVDESDRPRALRLLKVHHALFQGGVRPGDEMLLLAKSIENSDYVATCCGQAIVGETIVALAIFEVFMLEE